MQDAMLTWILTCNDLDMQCHCRSTSTLTTDISWSGCPRRPLIKCKCCTGRVPRSVAVCVTPDFGTYTCVSLSRRKCDWLVWVECVRFVCKFASCRALRRSDHSFQSYFGSMYFSTKCVGVCVCCVYVPRRVSGDIFRHALALRRETHTHTHAHMTYLAVHLSSFRDTKSVARRTERCQKSLEHIVREMLLEVE